MNEERTVISAKEQHAVLRKVAELLKEHFPATNEEVMQKYQTAILCRTFFENATFESTVKLIKLAESL